MKKKELKSTYLIDYALFYGSWWDLNMKSSHDFGRCVLPDVGITIR